jgi:hypothetical protein
MRLIGRFFLIEGSDAKKLTGRFVLPGELVKARLVF